MIETDSKTWRAVKDWADRRIAASRAIIEATGVDQALTEYERGRLAAVKELLALPEPRRNPAHSASGNDE